MLLMSEVNVIHHKIKINSNFFTFQGPDKESRSRYYSSTQPNEAYDKAQSKPAKKESG